MTLSAPTAVIFWISVVLFVLAVLGNFIVIPFITAYAFWIAIVAFIVLAAGCMMKGV